MTIKKFTPILIVESIESCLPFWEKQLGYETTASVPHDNKIGFVILRSGESEVMLQSRASLAADLPAIAKSHQVLLYADVASLDKVEKSLKGTKIAVPRRKTFYGTEEIWVQEPSGAIVGFAEHVG